MLPQPRYVYEFEIHYLYFVLLDQIQCVFDCHVTFASYLPIIARLKSSLVTSPPRPPLFVQIASSPLSPVRMRITSSTVVTKIFPSPILPVRAASVTTSTTFAALSSGTRTWIFTFGKKSTEYSAPR